MTIKDELFLIFWLGICWNYHDDESFIAFSALA